MSIFTCSQIAIKRVLIPVSLVAMSLFTVAARADLLAATEELESDCVEGLAGEVVGLECVVTVVTETPFSKMVKPSGKSGLGWTALGIDIETIVTVYAIGSETTTTEDSIQSVFVPGNPNLPGCLSSGSKPKKCFDHYEDVVIPGSTITEYFWELASSTITYEKVYTGCLNPGNHQMVAHKHCGF